MPEHLTGAADPVLRGILARYALAAPHDGDCLNVARQVTEALRQAGRAAQTVVIAGWAEPAALGLPQLIGRDQPLLGFLHHATRCDGLVLDGTARQFDPALPAAWILPAQDYLHELAHHIPAITHTSIDSVLDPSDAAAPRP